MPTLNYTDIGDVIAHEFLIGVITAFDHENQTATVKTIKAGSPEAYTPIVGKEYPDVKFFYHCAPDSALRSEGSIEGGIAGFMLGDEVVMEVTLSQESPLSTDYTNMRIISHTDEPRHCRRVRIYQAYVESGNWYVGVYDMVGGVLTKTQTLDPKADFTTNAPNFQRDKPIYIVDAHCDTNKINIIAHHKVTISGTDYIFPIELQYRIRWIYDFDQYYYTSGHWIISTANRFSFNAGEPWNNGMMAGGYRVHTALSLIAYDPELTPAAIEKMWDKNEALTGGSTYEGLPGTRHLPWVFGLDNLGESDIYGNRIWPAFQAQHKVWNDDNSDGIVNEHIQHAGGAFTTEWDPPDYHQRYVQIRGIGFLDNRMILGVLICFDDEHTPETGAYPDWYPALCDPCQEKFLVESYIAIFEGPPYYYTVPYLMDVEEPIGWGTPRFLDFEQTRLLNISSIAEFERINQIFGYDERIFISFRLPAQIYVYDDTGATLASLTPGGDNLCSMSIVESAVNGKPLLACQSFGGPVVLYDIDTLEVVESYTVPDSFSASERQSSIAVNVPLRTSASYWVEVDRYINKDEAPAGKTMNIIWHSPLASKLAQEHANWCVENARLSHIGKDDLDVHLRMYAVGIQYVAENLTFQWGDTPVLDSVIGWNASPGHRANLLFPADEGMGWGVATYPESCHNITIGPGRFIPETGGYTTGDTEWVVPPELYGKIKIYVFNGYAF